MALLQWFGQLAEGAEPVAVLGYAYALERMALFNTRERVEVVEAIIPSGTMATRCLRVHSAVGSDGNHVDESLQLMATLLAKDRRAIAMALYETIILMVSNPDLPPDGFDETITLFATT